MDRGRAMKLVPVIDLAGGVVVRAVRGERERYRPIESKLCPGHDPATIAVALAKHCAADTIYVADLDAIRGGAVQVQALAGIVSALPACALWLDAGFATVGAALELCGSPGLAGRAVPVFGSESLANGDELARLRGRHGVLLSLDQRGGAPMDPAGCWERSDCWPATLIVMTLDRVGAGAGPDLETFSRIRARAGNRTLVGAGGIRHPDDLRAAQQAGAAAWLVASALHDLAIPPVDGASRPDPRAIS